MAKSKKVRKHRQAEITLEPDGFSIHTFELSMQFSKSEWKKCKQKLYAEQEKNGGRWIYPDNRHDGHICTRYTDAGIRIRLEYNDTGNGKNTCFVRIIVNPRRLVSRKKEYLGIFPPDQDSIERLEKAFYSVLKKTPFPDDIHKYYLTRVDLCTNIRCKNNKVFRELVRLLRKTATPKKYERKFYQSRDRKKQISIISITFAFHAAHRSWSFTIKPTRWKRIILLQRMMACLTVYYGLRCTMPAPNCAGSKVHSVITTRLRLSAF